ncbi:MAG: hypothetical protein GY703_10465 [Gammaproteobacteria bacterium]|nr:hypothetical protein [Gammaproteobacteria bacterium]
MKKNKKHIGHWGLVLVFLMIMSHAQTARPYSDDMESGINGWAADGFWNLKESPENTQVDDLIRDRLVSFPDDARLPPCHSGSNCWWYGESATGTYIGPGYDQNQPEGSGGQSTTRNSGSLVSPAIDLTEVSQAMLSFYTLWEIEGVDVHKFDFMYVEISTDNGTEYTTLATLNPLNDVSVPRNTGYSTGGANRPPEWGQYLLDLSAYSGNTVRIRFRFDTVDKSFNGFRGWFIDDFTISSDAAPELTINQATPGMSRDGDIVAIEGTGFLQGATVQVGATDASVVVIFQDRMLIYVPSVVPGTYDVTVTNPGGASSTLTGTLVVSNDLAPVVETINPAMGSCFNSNPVTVTGQHFVAGASAYVGDHKLADISFVDENTLTGTIPPIATSGHQPITVRNPDGLQGVLYAGFGFTGAGRISGRVVNSQTGLGIPGVTLNLNGPGTSSTTTDATGEYSFTNLVPGEYDLTTSHPEYVDESKTVNVSLCQTANVPFSLSLINSEVDYRIVLTWDAQPEDLDSHIWVPTGSSCTHVYFSEEGNESSLPFTKLDTDNTSGFGPETITITQALPGTYEYWVNNYSEIPDLTSSGAVVKVYDGSSLLHTFEVPTMPAGNLAWHVFNLDTSTQTITAADRLEPDYSNANCIPPTGSSGITVFPTTGLITTEEGEQTTFSVVLDYQPSAEVSILLSSSDTTEGTVNPDSLTFNPDNWDTPQSVTVTGVSDGLDDGDTAFFISTAPASSSDPLFDGVNPSDVSITNIEHSYCDFYEPNDSNAEATPISNEETQTHCIDPQDDQDWMEFTLTEPAGVRIETFGPGGDTELWLYDENNEEIGYDNNGGDTNWSLIERTCGVDALAPGSYFIRIQDYETNNLIPEYDLSLVTTPCDAEIPVSPTSTSVNEGESAPFTLVLSMQPAADVTLGFSSSNDSECAVNPSSVQFSTADWNIPREVLITGVQDRLNNGDSSCTVISHPAISDDPVFHGLDPADVVVNVIDNPVYDLGGYFPLKTGQTWIYDVKIEGAAEWDHIEKVVNRGAATVNDIPTVYRAYYDPDYSVGSAPYEADYLAFDDQFFFWVAHHTYYNWESTDLLGLYVSNPPIQFPRRLAIGESVTSVTDVIDPGGTVSTFSLTVTLEGLEDITVPAGSYNQCLRLKFVENDDTIEYFWWAPGVGEVRSRNYESNDDVWRIRELRRTYNISEVLMGVINPLILD